jgi:hypothetical protein
MSYTINYSYAYSSILITHISILATLQLKLLRQLKIRYILQYILLFMYIIFIINYHNFLRKNTIIHPVYLLLQSAYYN